jgi:hypothetical protein
VVEEATAAFTDSRILVTEASTDRAHRVLVAPQQLVIGRDGTLRVAQARDESLVVGPDESEHDFSLQPYGESRQRDYESGQGVDERGAFDPGSSIARDTLLMRRSLDGDEHPGPAILA